MDHMSMSNSFNVNQYDGESIPWEWHIWQHGRDRYDADDPYGDGVTRDDLEQ
ncbi:MAG: hypothetical protein ACLRI8_04100 [Agathobacter rectalis]